MSKIQIIINKDLRMYRHCYCLLNSRLQNYYGTTSNLQHYFVFDRTRLKSIANGCRQLPTRWLATVNNVDGNCQQCGWQLPATWMATANNHRDKVSNTLYTCIYSTRSCWRNRSVLPLDVLKMQNIDYFVHACEKKVLPLQRNFNFCARGQH